MTITLYDLAAADPSVRFSPHCWRVKMALAHKELEVETVPWRFTEKDAIAASEQPKVPVILDQGKWVSDSWTIAEHLDAQHGGPKLFPSDAAKAHIRFLRYWTDTVLQPAILRQIIMPLFNQLAEVDKPYFRETREARFGMTLEEVAADAPAHVPALNAAFGVLRATLNDQKWLGGAEPDFGDYIVFGAFQWASYASPEDLLEADDPIYEWRRALRQMWEER